MNRKILITESDVDIIFLLSSLLKKHYKITILNNARLLLDGNFDKPDLFILNSHLSDVNIIAICRYLKENSETKNIPILIIAGSEDVETIAQQCPGDDFITKPFSGAELLNKVEKTMQNINAL